MIDILFCGTRSTRVAGLQGLILRRNEIGDNGAGELVDCSDIHVPLLIQVFESALF